MGLKTLLRATAHKDAIEKTQEKTNPFEKWVDTKLMHEALILWQTESFPMKQFMSHEQAGHEEHEMNNNAKAQFEKRFNTMFHDTYIQFSDEKKYVFSSINRQTNYNRYELVFKKPEENGKLSDRALFIHFDNGRIYTDDIELKDEPLTEKSLELLQAMFTYHSEHAKFQQYWLDNKEQN